MRYAEIVGGVQIPISPQEQALLNRAIEDAIDPKSLSEREAELARLMVRRGILLPVKSGTDDRLVPFNDPNMWRL